MNSTSTGSTKSAQWRCLCRGDISGAKLLFRMLTQFNNFMEVSSGSLFLIELTISHSYWSPLHIQASVKICCSPCIRDVLSIKVRNNFKTKILLFWTGWVFTSGLSICMRARESCWVFWASEFLLLLILNLIRFFWGKNSMCICVIFGELPPRI